jgi:predicted ester cyclase
MSARDNLSQAFRKWLAAFNAQDVDTMTGLTGNTVINEKKQLSGQEYIDKATKARHDAGVENTELDMTTIDTNGRAIAARLLHKSTLQKPYLGVTTGGQAFEWSEHVLVWFNEDLKIIRAEHMTDVEEFRTNPEKVTRTPVLDYTSALGHAGIKDLYEGYIGSINARTVKEELHNFCNPVVTHNQQVATLEDFQAFMQDSFTQVPDLHFTLTSLIIDEDTQQIASWLELSGKPVGTWAGIAPTGRSMRFPEIAFYKLDEGKIAFIWAIRDFETYRKCLETHH